jgi:hypothetical protein
MHLNMARFREASFERTVWAATPEAGVALDSLLDPAYWAHVAKRLKPWDWIEVRAEDGAYWALLLVIDASATSAKVQVLHRVELQAVKPEDAPAAPFKADWGGPTHKHRVLRLSDKQVMKTGFATKDEAEQWIKSHMRAMAA